MLRINFFKLKHENECEMISDARMFILWLKSLFVSLKSPQVVASIGKNREG